MSMVQRADTPPPTVLQGCRSCVCAPSRFRCGRAGDASTMAKIAVVTGGTAGVGRAAVRELAARGYDVAVLARGQQGLAGTVADVERAGRRGLGVAVDVADAGALDAAADQIERELGPIDVWINNAFVGFLAPFDRV